MCGTQDHLTHQLIDVRKQPSGTAKVLGPWLTEGVEVEDTSVIFLGRYLFISSKRLIYKQLQKLKYWNVRHMNLPGF